VERLEGEIEARDHCDFCCAIASAQLPEPGAVAPFHNQMSHLVWQFVRAQEKYFQIMK
jgi:hypothetical protein